ELLLDAIEKNPDGVRRPRPVVTHAHVMPSVQRDWRLRLQPDSFVYPLGGVVELNLVVLEKHAVAERLRYVLALGHDGAIARLRIKPSGERERIVKAYRGARVLLLVGVRAEVGTRARVDELLPIEALGRS